jgi:hypothetical protein
MKYKTTLHTSSALKLWRNVALEIVSKLKKQEIFINLGNTSTNLLKSECIRAVFETIDESPIRNMLLKCMLDAETASAGGSYILLLHLAGLLNEEEEILGHRFKLDETKSSLLSLVGHLASDIVTDAIKIAGRNGKIFLDASESQKTEISFGTQSCKWSPPASFFAAVKHAKVSVQNCRVIFIDGIIESVAECHKILQWSYEEKTPVVIFARGYAEEVIATTAINFQRQTAQVVPVVILFDEIGVNSLGDVASCFGSEVISSDKGQLISSIDISACVKADRITLSHNLSEIEFADNRVDSVVEKLSKKLLHCDVSQSEMIKKRIDALGTGSVTIKIGSENRSLTGIQRDRVDFAIRYMKSCLSHGIINIDDVAFPSYSVKSGIKCSKSFASILSSCAATLEVDKCG